MSGETGQIGALAVKHVEEASQQKVDQLWWQLRMAAVIVLVTVWRVSNATPKRAVSHNRQNHFLTLEFELLYMINEHISFLANYPTDGLSMSYCFENCTVPSCTNYDANGKSNCVSGLEDAVNPQRTLTLHYNSKHTCHFNDCIVEGLTCDKGGLYGRKATSDNDPNIISPNLGPNTTDKTFAILIRHEVANWHQDNHYNLDNIPDIGGQAPYELYQGFAIRLRR